MSLDDFARRGEEKAGGAPSTGRWLTRGLIGAATGARAQPAKTEKGLQPTL